jgi:hypothetical protein
MDDLKSFSSRLGSNMRSSRFYFYCCTPANTRAIAQALHLARTAFSSILRFQIPAKT